LKWKRFTIIGEIMKDRTGYKAIGNRLIELRDGKNLNQTQAATVITIPQRTYQNYEYGTSKPNTEYLKKIIDYYGCSYAWLLTGEGVPYPDRPHEKPDAPGEIPKFSDIFDDDKDLPQEELDALMDRLGKLSKNDTKRVISGLIVSSRRGDIDAVLLRTIYGVMKEFINKNGKKELDSNDFAISIIIQMVYRELRKIPTREEILSLIEALHVLGKVFPCGVPLTPYEQMELFSWGQLPGIGEKDD